jgi:hypothetical protein
VRGVSPPRICRNSAGAERLAGRRAVAWIGREEVPSPSGFMRSEVGRANVSTRSDLMSNSCAEGVTRLVIVSIDRGRAIWFSMSPLEYSTVWGFTLYSLELRNLYVNLSSMKSILSGFRASIAAMSRRRDPDREAGFWARGKDRLKMSQRSPTLASPAWDHRAFQS